MITVQKVLLLRKVDLFDAMPTRELGRVAEVTREVVHAAGETIVTEGEEGDALYLIVSGEVEVLRGGTPVHVLRETDYFGELAVLTGETRNATVRARTDCLLLRLPRSDFHQVLGGSFPAVLAVIRTICARLKDPR